MDVLPALSVAVIESVWTPCARRCSGSEKRPDFASEPSSALPSGARSATEAPSSSAFSTTGEASSIDPRRVGCALPSTAGTRSMCTRGDVRSTATVRVTIERLPARSLATSFTIVRPSGSFGSSAKAPLRGCMTTCLPE